MLYIWKLYNIVLQLYFSWKLNIFFKFINLNLKKFKVGEGGIEGIFKFVH